MAPRTVEESFCRYREVADTQALAEVFDRTAPDLLLLARHLAPVGNEAEDLLQATFLTAMESAPTYEAGRPLVPWLTGILANHARKVRRLSRTSAGAGRAEVGTSTDPEQEAQTAELRESLARCLDQTPDPYRPVLDLYLQHGFSPKEIAQTLGRSRATVRSQIHRGLEILRRGLPAGLAGTLAVASVNGRGIAAVRREVIATAKVGGALGGSLLTELGGLLSLKKTVGIGAVGLGVFVLWWGWPVPPGGETPPNSGQLRSAPLTADLGTTNEESGPESDRVQIPVDREAKDLPLVQDTGGLLVQVKRAGDGTPVPDRWITLIRPDAPYGVRYFPVRQARTDASGTIFFEGLEPAIYEIRPLLVAGRPMVTIRSGEREEQTLTVALGITVDGRVVDAAGNPVPGAMIYLDTGQTSHERPVAVTGPGGRFEIADVPSNYRLGALADGYAPSYHHPIEADPGQRESVTFVMNRVAATLRGALLDLDGNPIPRGFVAIQPVDLGKSYRDDRGRLWSPPEIQVLRTNEQGLFACHQVPAEPILIVAGSVDDLELLPVWEEMELIAGTERFVELRIPRGAVLEGIVRRGGQLVPGLEVHAIREDRNWSRQDAAYSASRFDHTSVFTDRTGAYRIAGLRPGTYRISAEGLDRKRNPESVTLRARETLQQDLALVPQGELLFRVVDAKNQPLENWQVTVHYRSVWPNSLTDSKGEVRFENFDQGEYTVLVEAPSDRAETNHVYVAVGVEDVPTGDEFHAIRVPANKMPSARIRVRILSPEGRVPDAAELAIDASVLRRPQWGSVPVDALGYAESGLLPPGTYKLTLRARDYPSLLLGEQQLRPNEVLDLGEVTVSR